MAGPLAEEYSDPIVIPFSLTIPDPRSRPRTGMSRMRRAVVMPANGWEEARQPRHRLQHSKNNRSIRRENCLHVTNDPLNGSDALSLSGSLPVRRGGSVQVSDIQLAQYAPTNPLLIPLPPVFIPGTPENEDFVTGTIHVGREIRDAIGHVFNSEASDPVDTPAITQSPADPNPPASSPVGIEVQPGTNSPGTIGDRRFGGHSFDRMQRRGLPPSVVIDTIQNGQTSPGNEPNTSTHYSPENNLTVVTDNATGNVITVRKGKP